MKPRSEVGYLAARNKSTAHKLTGELHSEKVVIVTGPSFATVVEFILLGAALGAAATIYYYHSQSSSTGSGEDAVLEGVTGGGHKNVSSVQQFVRRLSNVATRATSVAQRVREAAQTAGEVIGPTFKEAVAEARNTAQETEHQLEEEINSAPDAPSVATEQA
ncbi:MAG: hypothetical protein M3347_11120 [Armatimonadota bacterium]|nr:hypothetical protein [Armatimonadota bacterium]